MSHVRRFVPALAATLAASLMPGAAMAYCGGAECYEKVRTPDIYADEHRPVVVHPASREVVWREPVVGIRSERVIIAPGGMRTWHRPAEIVPYVTRELVASEQAGYRVAPAETAIMREEVVVRPGSVHWVHQRDLFGRERLCKVVTPPVTRWVDRRVTVLPERLVAVVQPAVYRDVVRPVLARPAETRRFYQPPVVAYRERPVVVAPARREVIVSPAEVEYESRRVQVERGRTAWRPVGDRLF
jgi:hypothetical protein